MCHRLPYRKPLLDVCLDIKPSNNGRLFLKDNGIGFSSEQFDWRQIKNLGFHLVQALGEGKLQGMVLVAGTNVSLCEIVSPMFIYRKRVKRD